jgi:hypothetical protein
MGSQLSDSPLKRAALHADHYALSGIQEVRSRAFVRQVPLFRAECPDCGWTSLTTSDRELASTMGTRHDAACQRMAGPRRVAEHPDHDAAAQ